MIEVKISEWEDINSLSPFISADNLLSIDIDPNKFIDNDFYSTEGKRCKIKCLRFPELIGMFSDTGDENFFFKNFYPYEDNYEVKLPEKTQYIKKFFKVVSGSETLFIGVPDYNSYSLDYVNETVEFELVDLTYILFENFEDNSDLRLFLSYFRNIYLNGSGTGVVPLFLANMLLSFNSFYPINISERIDKNLYGVENAVSIPYFTQIFKHQPKTKQYIFDKKGSSGYDFIDELDINSFGDVEQLTFVNSVSKDVVFIEFIYKETTITVLEQDAKFGEYLVWFTRVHNINTDLLSFSIAESTYSVYIKSVPYSPDTYPDYKELLIGMLLGTIEHGNLKAYEIVFVNQLISQSGILSCTTVLNTQTVLDLNSLIQLKYYHSEKLIEAKGDIFVIYDLAYNSNGSVNLTSGNTSGIFNPDKFSQAECLKCALLSAGRYLTFTPSNTFNRLEISSEDIIQKYLDNTEAPQEISSNDLISFSKKQEIFLIEKALNDLNYSETDRHFLLYIIKSNIVKVFSSIGKTLKLTCLLTNDIKSLDIGDTISLKIEPQNTYLINSVARDYYNYTVEFELIQIKSNSPQKYLDISRDSLILLSQFER